MLGALTISDGSLGEVANFEASSKALRNIYDGDTFNLAFRLAHIDTPEIKGKCDAEKDLAIQARDYTRAFLKDSGSLTITVVDVGYYGRPIVEVRSARGYLNDLLLKSGLAQPYIRGKKIDWCHKE